jgi:choline dehydrogenase-like flavoprotein
VTSSIETDVLVVGAGAGGAAVAGALAAGGCHVIVLEAGPPRDGWPLGHARNIDPTENGLAAFAKRLDEFLVWPSFAKSAPPGLAGAKIAHGVGGMFGLWTCNCPWPHPDELPPWDDRTVWLAYIRRAHALLNVQEDFGANGVRTRLLLERLKRAIGNLPEGRQMRPMPVAVTPSENGLRFSSIQNLLAPGKDREITILPNLVVHRILHQGAKTFGVEAHGADDDRLMTVRAEAVVVAAGTIGCGKLLAGSGVDVGPALGCGVFDHPAFASRIAFQDEIAQAIPAEDPLVTLWVPYSPAHPWHTQLCRFPGRPAPIVPIAPDHQTIDIFNWIPMDINPDNRLIFDNKRLDHFGLPEVTATLRLSAADRGRAASALAEHFEIASEIGDLSEGWFPAFYKPGEASHLMGSCRMGPRDDGDSVVDREGKLWKYDNLFVAGNAVLAQTNGGNPTMTTIAAALRCADRILGTRESVHSFGVSKPD